MARILKALTAFMAWRWTPCVALIASSVLFVLIAIAAVPTTIGLPGTKASSPESEAVNVISDTPRSERPTPPSPRRPTAPATPAPSPVGVLMPNAPPQPVDDKRAEPPPPPPPPAPAPTPTQTEDDDQPETPAPPPAPGPPSSRFMSTPLRFLGQAVNRPQGAPGAPGGEAAPSPAPAPANPAPPDDER